MSLHLLCSLSYTALPPKNMHANAHSCTCLHDRGSYPRYFNYYISLTVSAACACCDCSKRPTNNPLFYRLSHPLNLPLCQMLANTQAKHRRSSPKFPTSFRHNYHPILQRQSSSALLPKTAIIVVPFSLERAEKELCVFCVCAQASCSLTALSSSSLLLR